MSTSVRPGSTTAPSPSTRADTAARSESSMSVAASRSSPSPASSRMPDRIWIDVRLETARPTSDRPWTSSSFVQVILSPAPTAMSLSII